jgi:uncharacterized membrane protein YuzA (DUF378 family)
MSSNKELVQQFFVNERVAQRRAVVMTWTLIGLANVLALVMYLQGATLRSIATGLVGVFGVALLMLFWRVRQRTTLQERLTRLLDSIEFGWEELHGLELNPSEADHLHVAFSTTAGRIATNEIQLRPRGNDEKGPAFDRSETAVDPTKQRVDPAIHEADYIGLEGELGVAETLVEEANHRYAEEAQRQWAKAEARDMDNIEAGVKRLGDLVASGWFEANAEDGALAKLMEESSERDA